MTYTGLHLIAHCQTTGDLSGTRRLVFVGNDGVPRNHGQRGKPAERVDDILCQSIGEIIALWISVLALEWKYGDRGSRAEFDFPRGLIASKQRANRFPLGGNTEPYQSRCKC